MKKIFPLLLAVAFTANCVHAQNTFPTTGAAGIGTVAPNASSLLEINSTTKGFLPPRMTQAQRNAIASPVNGLLIYQTNNAPGLYYYNGTGWNAVTPSKANTTLNNLTSPTAINQALQPNATGTLDIGNPSFNWRDIYFSGTLIKGNVTIMRLNGDNTALGANALISNSSFGNTATGYIALLLNTIGERNTANGYKALYSNTTGSWNAALGAEVLYANTTGYFNTANGFYAMNKNTTGDRNVAAGSYALTNNTTGAKNAANGVDALYANTTGSTNIANGFEALHNNTTGYSNVAIGAGALYSNTAKNNLVAIGDSALFNNANSIIYYESVNNVAVGSKSLYNNTTGGQNTALGTKALTGNTNGSWNTATGSLALSLNNDGGSNTATGYNALGGNTGGNGNTAMGAGSLQTNSVGLGNTALGMNALNLLSSGFYNTATGYLAGAAYNSSGNNTFVGAYADANAAGFSNSTALGYQASITNINQVRIGNGNVTSIGGYAGWTTLPSDKRFKKNIQENVPGLSFINKLKPVTYNLDLDAIDKLVQHPGNNDNSIADETIQIDKQARKVKQETYYTGFIAQDVEKAAKELNYDFSGVDAPKNDKDVYGIRYAEFVVPLVKAVQELSKINYEKDTKIDALEKRMEKLEAMMNAQQSSATNNPQTVKLNNVSSLEQNIPNPFNSSTTISYTLPQQYSKGKIIVADKNGKTIKEINLSGNGKGSIKIDAALLSSGTYHYSLYVDGKMIDSKQMVFAR